MEDDMRRRLAERLEFRSTSILTNNIAPANPPVEPLTIETIRRLMLAMPPRETWLSSKLFPPGGFIVEARGEKFTCAHPSFWLRLLIALRKDAVHKLLPNALGFDPTPIEIDAWPDDAPDTAIWRAAHWARLREAVEVAMIPLPDWLRAKR